MEEFKSHSATLFMKTRKWQKDVANQMAMWAAQNNVEREVIKMSAKGMPTSGFESVIKCIALPTTCLTFKLRTLEIKRVCLCSAGMRNLYRNRKIKDFAILVIHCVRVPFNIAKIPINLQFVTVFTSKNANSMQYGFYSVKFHINCDWFDALFRCSIPSFNFDFSDFSFIC